MLTGLVACSEYGKRQPRLVGPAEQSIIAFDQAGEHAPGDGVVLVQPVEPQPRRDQRGDDVAERMDPLVRCVLLVNRASGSA